MTDFLTLDARQIRQTLDRLVRRIEGRFPGASLAGVAGAVRAVAGAVPERAAWLERPMILLRAGVCLVLCVLVGLLFASLSRLSWRAEESNVLELVQAIEAGTSELLLLIAGVLFLGSLERRIKRARVLRWLHELRALVHIIDLHQLAKDPERVAEAYRRDANSPEALVDPPRLERYLDYCSELVSLTGKLAAYYAQRFQDPVALQTVVEIEQLSTALSAKIWQKIQVLHTILGPRRAAVRRGP